MKSHTQYVPSHACAILLVGEPKTGKTRTIFSFPKPGILDCDMNLNSAVRVIGNKPFIFSQPAFDDNDKEVAPEDRWIRAVSETKKLIAETEVQTVVIDGLGILCEWLMAHVVKENKRLGTNKTGKMELRDYGDVGRMLRDYIAMLRVGGKYVVVTSHQVADKDELTGAIRYALAIPGASKETLGGLFTDVWATTCTRNGMKHTYEIRTKPTGFHVSLGTSFNFPSAIDVTDKSPDQIWSILKPEIERK